MTEKIEYKDLTPEERAVVESEREKLERLPKAKRILWAYSGMEGQGLLELDRAKTPVVEKGYQAFRFNDREYIAEVTLTRAWECPCGELITGALGKHGDPACLAYVKAIEWGGSR